jgi:hypothetical protein
MHRVYCRISGNGNDTWPSGLSVCALNKMVRVTRHLGYKKERLK